MNIKHLVQFLIFLFFTFHSTWGIGFEEMNDHELNAITAGNTDIDYENLEALSRIPIRYSSRKGSIDGEVLVVPMTTFNQASSLELTDNAQSNLRSLININAVSSPIQVLLNLNINVNSTIGKVNQLNTLFSD